jgi:DNA-dependent RNA polymerase auxiliary subunit epsilon
MQKVKYVKIMRVLRHMRETMTQAEFIGMLDDVILYYEAEKDVYENWLSENAEKLGANQDIL